MRVRHHERRLRARFLPGEGLVRCRRHASQRPQHTTGGTDAQKHGRRTARTRGRTAPSRRCLRPASSSMRACPIVDLGRARRRAVRARMASHRSARRVLPVLPGVPRGCLGDVDGGRCCDDQAVASGSISPGPGSESPWPRTANRPRAAITAPASTETKSCSKQECDTRRRGRTTGMRTSADHPTARFVNDRTPTAVRSAAKTATTARLSPADAAVLFMCQMPCSPVGSSRSP